MMTGRSCTAWLVDELPEAEIDPTLGLVETQRHDPLLQALANAPEDDEPWTDEDEPQSPRAAPTWPPAARAPMRRCSASTDDCRP